MRKQSLSRNRCLSARKMIRSYCGQALAAYNLSWKPSATKGKQLADAERAEAAGSRVSLQHPQNTTAGCCFYRQSWSLPPTITLSDSRGAKAVLPLIAVCPFSPATNCQRDCRASLSCCSACEPVKTLTHTDNAFSILQASSLWLWHGAGYHAESMRRSAALFVVGRRLQSRYNGMQLQLRCVHTRTRRTSA